MLALQSQIKDVVAQYRATKKDTVMLVGSVHKGELDYYLTMFKELKKEHTNIKLMLAPRFFDWKDELTQKLAATGLTFTVWDEKIPCPPGPAHMLEKTAQLLGQNDILAVCLLGKLFAQYPLADLFFLGGTFVPVGGHNVLEPAVWGNPIIIGPDYANTKEIADQLKEHDALVQVLTPEALIQETRRMLADTPARIAMGQRAAQWLGIEAARVRSNIQYLIKDLSAHIEKADSRIAPAGNTTGQ